MSDIDNNEASYFTDEDDEENEDENENENENEEENEDDEYPKDEIEINLNKPKLEDEFENNEYEEMNEDEDDYDSDNNLNTIQNGGVFDENKSTIIKNVKSNNDNFNDNSEEESDDDDEHDYDENYLQKFNTEINKNYITNNHPECFINNSEEISALIKIVYDQNKNIIDPLHKCTPYLTKFEKARIIGTRAKQINAGSKPFIKIDNNIIEGEIIATMELAQKKIPFIIRRFIPGGHSEYWNIQDLEILQ
jgi:DNA-directed RNA polymerase subunit K/omega